MLIRRLTRALKQRLLGCGFYVIVAIWSLRIPTLRQRDFKRRCEQLSAKSDQRVAWLVLIVWMRLEMQDVDLLWQLFLSKIKSCSLLQLVSLEPFEFMFGYYAEYTVKNEIKNKVCHWKQAFPSSRPRKGHHWDVYNLADCCTLFLKVVKETIKLHSIGFTFNSLYSWWMRFKRIFRVST